MSKPRKTPAEMIAETEARLSRLRVKQAKKNASSNPAVAALLQEQEDLRKQVREARKGLGDGPQSFNASIAKHEAWIFRIENRRAMARAALESATARLVEIEFDITTTVDGLLPSETPNQKAAPYAQ